ncbi:MAG: general secretion pathway protein I [Methyloprofundus sp.]|nr:MAG: general secretion pathway protein I [Methyloprofundus sp.]
MYCQSKGFTLIEVMVALAVIAIGLLAVLNTANQQVKSASITQNKMAAYWLMKNKIAEIRLTDSWPAIKHHKGIQTSLQQTWYWQTQTSATDNPEIRKVTISIAAQKTANDIILEQTIYLSKPE